MNRLALTALTACLMGAALTACDSGTAADAAADDTQAAKTLCGAALSDAARSSVQDLVRVKDFKTLGPEQGAQHTASDLVVHSETNDFSNDHELCRAFAPSAEATSTSVAFSLEEEALSHPASSFTEYKLGVPAPARRSTPCSIWSVQAASSRRAGRRRC
ncbi:hypothetical protein [Streptomyces sp. NPDC058371]|uniref:hypothetical protein n=1 Tax=Streptomyces sp. NPDC058371 TaxID=3346463 RepID=UPI003668D890